MKTLQIIRKVSQFVFFALLFTTFFKNFKAFSIIVLVSTILGGIFYCGWICPFGLVQDLGNLFNKKFIKKKYKLPISIQKYAVFLRYIIFILTLSGLTFLFIIDARFSFTTLITNAYFTTTSLIVISIFILLSIFIDRPFCNYFCFDGARYGLFSTLRLFNIKRDKKICIDCKLCDKNCPMNINISQNNNVRSLQCINCFNCISSCPKKGALKYDFVNFKNLKRDIKFKKIKNFFKKNKN